MKAFYFAPQNNKLRYGDDREIVIGETHGIEGTPELCKRGLHASERLIDALRYAPGNTLYLVTLGGEFDKGDDKVCATERTYLDSLDCEKLLKEFARKVALINVHKIKPHCSEGDYELIIHWLETGDESIREAAYSAAYSVAYSAADSAACSAAYSTAREAAYSVARSAAYSAARSAAYSVALEEYNEMLTQMVKEATGWEI